MNRINFNIIGAVLCFLSGVGIASANFFLAKHFLKKRSEKISVISAIRQFIQVIFLFIAFFIGKYTDLNEWYLLIGAALGLTLPMIYFTPKLLSLTTMKFEKTEEKEANSDG